MKRLLGFAIIIAVLAFFVWTFWKGANYDQLVSNGVQQVWICGKKKGTLYNQPIMDEISRVIPGVVSSLEWVRKGWKVWHECRDCGETWFEWEKNNAASFARPRR